jgi:hypothetical protein
MNGTTGYIPAKSVDGVTEGGQPIDKTAGVKYLNTEDECVALALESGNYRFQVR